MARDTALESYLANGVKDIVQSALRATLRSPRESLFLLQFSRSSQRAERMRARQEAAGEHIPPFLIASITSRCNLHCVGCYARANYACGDSASALDLTGLEWADLFDQAEKLGVSFILLAGGEPLLRQDVLEQAARRPNLLFPVFTNGTMLSGTPLSLFDQNRNLVPILSIEGDAAYTDARRGAGMYDTLMDAMERLSTRDILFGVSITVTRENLLTITDGTFLDHLSAHGCKVIVYVEYVPVSGDTALAPTQEDRAYLTERLAVLRPQSDMLLISFPGDERISGGCLAAGRGFFHINSVGGAEPCPFSPYSDTNLRDLPLREALHSPLFQKLSDRGMLLAEHDGGCVLFDQDAVVQELLR